MTTKDEAVAAMFKAGVELERAYSKAQAENERLKGELRKRLDLEAGLVAIHLEREKLLVQVKGKDDALRLLLPFVEDEWQGSRGCLMPNCVLEAGHTKECPIGIGRAALAEGDGDAV